MLAHERVQSLLSCCSMYLYE